MPPLSDEEKRKILSSGDFSRFFTQASRVIERALAEEVTQHSLLTKDTNQLEVKIAIAGRHLHRLHQRVKKYGGGEVRQERAAYPEQENF